MSMVNQTPKCKPLEAKGKAHARAAKRAKAQTQEALRDKLNGSATIGRINANTRKIQAMLKPAYYESIREVCGQDVEATLAMIDKELQIRSTLIRNDFSRLKYLLPTLRSVELKGHEGPLEIIVRLPDAD